MGEVRRSPLRRGDQSGRGLSSLPPKTRTTQVVRDPHFFGSRPPVGANVRSLRDRRGIYHPRGLVNLVPYSGKTTSRPPVGDDVRSLRDRRDLPPPRTRHLVPYSGKTTSRPPVGDDVRSLWDRRGIYHPRGLFNLVPYNPEGENPQGS